jgi:hypothetical protein
LIEIFESLRFQLVDHTVCLDRDRGDGHSHGTAVTCFQTTGSLNRIARNGWVNLMEMQMSFPFSGADRKYNFDKLAPRINLFLSDVSHDPESWDSAEQQLRLAIQDCVACLVPTFRCRNTGRVGRARDVAHHTHQGKRAKIGSVCSFVLEEVATIFRIR